MTKISDVEANLEQFKSETLASQEETRNLFNQMRESIDRNKVEADRQFAEIMNALKSLQPTTTLPEDTATMIDTEKSAEDSGNLEEFMVASDVEEAAITTPIMVVAEELERKLIYDFGEADLMLGSEGESIESVSCDPPIESVSCDPPAGNKSVQKENIKSGITCEENCYQPYRLRLSFGSNKDLNEEFRILELGDMVKQHLEDKVFLEAGVLIRTFYQFLY
ncbi:hypothetical protein Tco_1299740 [Tanacetum coccineum]